MDLIVGRIPPRLFSSICPRCMRNLGRRNPLYPSNVSVSQRRYQHIAKPGTQAQPLTGFYEDLLEKPIPKTQPGTRTQPAPPPPDELPKTEKERTLERARIVFGSRLAGPSERRAQLEAASTNIAGIMVPPRPTEPDNCCMSGCVNCVWDNYRDELEVWAAVSAQARARLDAQRERQNQKKHRRDGQEETAGMPQHVASSMDDDGGGSETNWDAGALNVGGSGKKGDIFEGIPVGIREFMRTEKKLKEKHRMEGSLGG
ncbi:hypothetical protein M501DRAFT_1000016 [Patellaria atrata CBS 101060]|uniref:Oxidoreductase-like domain-containing protein n=1 Tax=Patellaria atrata CBS 101060 TaxID=1346257 RepID=A0A9P4S483_9PEZI|nr:hypothetical protein M501DRAFT_1000016 [Patellaria atrata CBS 101060]